VIFFFNFFLEEMEKYILPPLIPMNGAAHAKVNEASLQDFLVFLEEKKFEVFQIKEPKRGTVTVVFTFPMTEK
jgi:hypothetical protein